MNTQHSNYTIVNVKRTRDEMESIDDSRIGDKGNRITSVEGHSALKRRRIDTESVNSTQSLASTPPSPQQESEEGLHRRQITPSNPSQSKSSRTSSEAVAIRRVGILNIVGGPRDIAKMAFLITLYMGVRLLACVALYYMLRMTIDAAANYFSE